MKRKADAGLQRTKVGAGSESSAQCDGVSGAEQCLAMHQIQRCLLVYGLTISQRFKTDTIYAFCQETLYFSAV